MSRFSRLFEIKKKNLKMILNKFDIFRLINPILYTKIEKILNKLIVKFFLEE